MGKVMSKEKDARDVALREYDTFMDKYKSKVEAGDMKLLQHMLRLEADKIRTQSIIDSIEKSKANISESVYGDSASNKMKIQMSRDEYHKDQLDHTERELRDAPKQLDEREKAFVKMATAPISIGDPDKVDAYKIEIDRFSNTMMSTNVSLQKDTPPPPPPSVIEIDEETGKKVYKGPKLRSRKIVDGKVWDSSHPNFHDKNVGGM